MRTPADLVVHGAASPSLLRNLDEFQAAWVMWHPNHYTHIAIQVDTAQEQSKAPTNAVLSGFSGGLDSSFSIFRHRNQNLGHAQQNVTTSIFIHGFDISLSRVEAYNRAVDRGKNILESLGVALIPMAMNLKQLEDNWDHSHGAALASCLMLLQGGFSAGLIASSAPYSAITPESGSNPVTDWLLGSASFPIIHDGAGFTRFDKVHMLAHWPSALQNLRVCQRGAERDKNCCRCRKCVRTILYFRFVGCGLPPCFEQDASDFQVLITKYPNQSGITILREILAAAIESGAPLATRLALRGSIVLNYSLMRLYGSNLYRVVKRFVRHRSI